jgi:hypothetical protein
LMSCFPGMLLRYSVNDSEMVPVAPIFTGITFFFTFHIHCISIVRSLYFKIFSASFLFTFLSPEMARSTNGSFLFRYHRLWCPIIQLWRLKHLPPKPRC